MDDLKLKQLIAKAIDMHVHVGPEIIPRRYTAASLAASESGKLAGAVLKNHFYPAVSLVNNGGKQFKEYGSIVLNWSVGGLNPEAIRAASYVANGPFVVWLPTIHAQNFLDKSDYELAPEWCSGRNVKTREAAAVVGIRLTRSSGQLTARAKRTLEAIKDTSAILATGHISAEESQAVVNYAQEIGIKRIVLTHPIYPRSAMSTAQQKVLAQCGCFVEVCYSMYYLDGIAIKAVVNQIRAIGPAQTLLSSDMGQLTSPAPSQGLYRFAKLLLKEGIPVEWLETMLVTNPRLILKGSD
jgi:hypothetical protein